MRILYVEDEPHDFALTQLCIGKTNPAYQLDHASDLHSALAKLQNPAAYDVVLTDLLLPDGNGLSLIGYIRERALPLGVVVVTSLGDESTAWSALRAGADDFLVKQGDYLSQLTSVLERVHSSVQDDHARSHHVISVLYLERSGSTREAVVQHLSTLIPHWRIETIGDRRELESRAQIADGLAGTDILLVGFDPPDLRIYAVLKNLVQFGKPDLPVVLMVAPDDEPIAVHALRTGVADYVVRESDFLRRLPLVMERAYYQAEGERQGVRRRMAEQACEQLFNTSWDMLCVAGFDGFFKQVNPAWTRVLGWTQAELLNRPYMELVHSEDQQQTMSAAEALQSGETIETFENRYLCRDGSYRWLSWDSQPDLEQRQIVGVVRDITESKLQQHRIQTEQQMAIFKMLADHAADGILILNHAGCVQYANQASHRLFGYHAHTTELVGMHVAQLWPETGLKRADGEVFPMASWQGERPQRRRDGTVFVASISSFPLQDSRNNLVLGACIIRDITTQKMAQEALQESQDRYRALFSAITDAVLVHTLHDELQPGVIIDVNDVTCATLGYSKEELLKLSIQDLDAPESPIDRAHLVHELKAGHSILFEQVLLTKKGTRQPVEVHAQAFSLKGKPVVLATCRDISERKRADEIVRARNLQLMASEQQLTAANIMLMENERQLFKKQTALMESEKRLQTILERLPVGVLVSNRESQAIDYVNPAGAAMIGLPQDHILRQSRRAFFPGVKPSEGANLTGGLEIQGEEQTLVPITGNAIPVLRTATHVQLYGHEEILEVFVDLSGQKKAESERKQLENQLRQSQKMEAVGQLAGGVAHDFNNLLQAIQGNTELALVELGVEHSARGYLREAKQASDKAATLVRQLLAFSRRLPLKRESLDLNQIISELVKMLRRLIGEHIDLEIHTTLELPRINADRSQIEQVLMNLCVNSRDAMPEGGKILIATSWAPCVDNACNCTANKTVNRFVRLTVEDTGIGIPTELKAKIFEPFFTTKEIGKGTGLGLSTVFSIVKQHEGYISFQSEPGRGTSFHICLPTSQIASTSDAVIQSPPTATAGHGETILLAEDEELVRNLTLRILERAGYRVHIARNGQEAIEMFQADPTLYELVILDVVMPKKGGPQVYHEIHQRYPDLPVLFSSGYSFDQLDTIPSPPSHVPMIQKPFEPDDLLGRVRELLPSKKI
jgi:two-component system, cell cycle sensor histidine kinase and response regulator CckA